MKLIYTMVLGFLASNVQAESFMPKNNLHLQDNKLRINANNLVQTKFNEIIDNVIHRYGPVVAAFGGNLSANRYWDDSTVNASAEQFGNNWIVNMYGGLARRDEITPDGFAMVVCHELGHHLGGFSFYSDADWAGAEGQADYFALQTCAKDLWANDKEENAKHRASVTTKAKMKCDSIYTKTEEQDICYRSSDASLSLASLLAALGDDKKPSYETPDLSSVSQTNPYHPAAQCRLDTYLAGFTCLAAMDHRIIPGKNVKNGRNSLEAEQESARYSCTNSGGFKDGIRPSCWFKGRL